MKTGINVGIAGLGLMGERHVAVYDKMPVVNVYAVCDTQKERAEALAEKYSAKCYTDIEEMIKDPELDAVDIVLPDRLHRDAILLAAKYGKHIMVEKPMASTVEDAQIIADALKGYDKTFMIGQILRFDARYGMAKQALLDGKIGKPVSVYARRNSPVTGPKHYNGTTDLIPHVMVHDIDAIQWILGEKIKTVYAKASDNVLHESNMLDCVQCMFTTESGLFGQIEACWILPEASPTSIDDQLEIIGTDSVIYTQNCGNGYMLLDANKADAIDSRHWPEFNGGIAGALYEELTEFVRCAEGSRKSMISADDGLYLIKVVSAIEKSVKEHREVTVE